MSVDPVRVQALYETTLKPRLAALEQHRHALRSYIIKGLASVGIPFLLWLFGDAIGYLLGLSSHTAYTTLSVVLFLLIIGGAGFAIWRYGLAGTAAYANYKGKFKQDVVSEIFKITCPTAKYEPQHGMAQDVFVGCGIFQDRGSYSTDDRVRGRIGQTPFEAAEVKRQYSTGGKNSQTRTVFHGLFFHLDFNKSLSGVTFVQPETAHSYQIGDRREMTVAALENPDFEKEFKVWTTNEVEARYILTPVMMEKLLALRQAAEHPVFLGFRGNRAFLGVHYGRSLFEPGIASTTSLDSIQEMAEHFALAEVVVNELDLNTRIWTKGVDDSLLHAPGDPDANPLDALAGAQAGTLTGADIWKAATDAVGAEREDKGPPVQRPSGTRIAIEQRHDGAIVSYGYSVGFIVCLLISAACAAVVVSAVRLLGEDGFWPPGTPTAWLPAIPPVDDVVRAQPLAWLIPCAVVGAFLSLYWIFRVHKVEITPSTIYIHRGLRPVARRYSRPPYDVIVTLDTSVHVGRTGARTLINPTASPNLSKDEARWVGQEMRRALKQTMHGRSGAAGV